MQGEANMDLFTPLICENIHIHITENYIIITCHIILRFMDYYWNIDYETVVLLIFFNICSDKELFIF